MQTSTQNRLEKNQQTTDFLPSVSGIVWPDGETLVNPGGGIGSSSSPQFGFVRYPNASIASPIWGTNSAYTSTPSEDQTASWLKSISIPVGANIQKISDRILVDAVLSSGMHGTSTGKIILKYNGYTVDRSQHKIFAFLIESPDDINGQSFVQLLNNFLKGNAIVNSAASIPNRIIGIADDPNYNFFIQSVQDNHLNQLNGESVPDEIISCFL